MTDPQTESTPQTPQDQAPELPKLGDRLTEEQVVAFAKLALVNIQTEYPNKPGNVMADEASVRTPRQMHPAFYGSFDWHSSVHQHWMLVRLLKDYPGSSVDSEIRAKLTENLAKENLEAEVSYFEEDQNKAFERMYGWAWYFRLAAELHDWDDPDGKSWRENLVGLENLLVDRCLAYLRKLDFPIRTGVHPDTGFALGQILDYARVIGNSKLEKLIQDRARDYYLNDVSYPARYEPSGQDFFSSCLNEADLMRRVLSPAEFVDWFDMFLPNLKNNNARFPFEPVDVSDIADGKIVHLAGLDLSRAWCMEGIASALPEDDSRVKLLRDSARAHAEKGFGYVFSGDYAGEHWLATFAIYLQAGIGVGKNLKETSTTVTNEKSVENPIIVTTSAMDRSVQILGSTDAGEGKPTETKIEIVIVNESKVAVADMDISLFLDPGIRLTKFDYGETDLTLVNRSEDFSRFDVKRCTLLEANAKLRFVATVMGTKVGDAKFKVTAVSEDNNQTAVSSVEMIEVTK